MTEALPLSAQLREWYRNGGQCTFNHLFAEEYEEEHIDELIFQREKRARALKAQRELFEEEERLVALEVSQRENLDNSTGSIDVPGGKDEPLYKYRGTFTLPDGQRKEITGKTVNDALQKTADAMQLWYEENGVEPKPTAPGRQEKGVLLEEWVGRLMEVDAIKELTRKQTYWRKWIRPYFKGKTVQEIRHTDCQGFADHLSKTPSKTGGPMSSKTAKQILGVLSSIMKQAVMDGLIDRNPADGVRNRCKEAEDKYRSLTDEELLIILNLMSEIEEENVRLWTAISFSTGMRPEEIMALKWSDYHTDEEIPYFSVTKAVQTQGLPKGQKGAMLKEPKTKAGKRNVPVMCARAVKVLNEARQPDGYIIRGKKTNRDGKRHIGDSQKTTIYNRLNAYLSERGITDRTTGYDGRHTVATLLHNTGAVEKSIKYMMGHAGTDFTLTTYIENDWKQVKKDAIKVSAYWESLVNPQSNANYKEKSTDNQTKD